MAETEIKIGNGESIIYDGEFCVKRCSYWREDGCILENPWRPIPIDLINGKWERSDECNNFVKKRMSITFSISE